MPDQAPVVATERTRLDRVTLEDAAFFVELMNSPGWLRYIGDRGIKTIDGARAYLAERFLNPDRAPGVDYFVIRLTAGGTPIGTCGFLQRPELEHPDFGFALLPAYAGRGLAEEACRALLDESRAAFGSTTLDAITRADNQPSIRLLEKLGFGFERTLAADDEGVALRLYRREHPA